MTARDRFVLMGLTVAGILALAWFLLVSPERKEAAHAQTAVVQARERLTGARDEASRAQAARRSYESSYATIVSLGAAVPSSPEVPSLIYQLEAASSHKSVQFESITSSSATGTSAATANAASASSASGFTSIPFTFVFEGTFASLSHLLGQLDDLTTSTPGGTLEVDGRLLTIQGVSLTAPTSSSSSQAKGIDKNVNRPMTGTVTASAYTLPAGTSVTSGATAAGPSAATGTRAASSPASGGSMGAAPSAATTAAVIGAVR